jgi:tellurite methyltransferase
VLRTIDGFIQDEHGDWVAALSCLHRQHVRHQPPFRDRPWVLTEPGRAEHVGTALDCPLCDRAELPPHLEVVRTAGPFDATTLPPGLRRSHRVAERTWACLRVLDGSVRFTMDTTPPVDIRLGAGDARAIPPGVTHTVSLGGAARIAVDFLIAPG